MSLLPLTEGLACLRLPGDPPVRTRPAIDNGTGGRGLFAQTMTETIPGQVDKASTQQGNECEAKTCEEQSDEDKSD